MNLHGIVSAAIGAVNPQQQITIQVSTGNTVAADGTPIPAYAPAVQVTAQVQALTGRDIEHADALNISGIRRALYINGEVDGLVRPSQKGGDLVQLADGSIWLVAEVVEHWPDWTKCIIVLQDDTALPPSA